MLTGSSVAQPAQLDDVAIFAEALTDAEIAARWNQSLTARLAASQEPNLVLFWNFNDPVSTAGEIPNVGLAGAAYNLKLGRLPKVPGAAVFETRHGYQGALYDFEAPRIVPSSDPRTWTKPKAIDATAPLVTHISAGKNLRHPRAIEAHY